MIGHCNYGLKTEYEKAFLLIYRVLRQKRRQTKEAEKKYKLKMKKMEVRQRYLTTKYARYMKAKQKKREKKEGIIRNLINRAKMFHIYKLKEAKFNQLFYDYRMKSKEYDRRYYIKLWLVQERMYLEQEEKRRNDLKNASSPQTNGSTSPNNDERGHSARSSKSSSFVRPATAKLTSREANLLEDEIEKLMIELFPKDENGHDSKKRFVFVCLHLFVCPLSSLMLC